MYKKINEYGEKYTEVSFGYFEKQFNKTFDFDFFIPYSLGCSELLHNKIKELYSPNKDTYYRAYKNSTYFKDDRILSLSVLNQISTQRLIGILAVLDPQEKEITNIKLIKGPFKFIYQYVQRAKSVDIFEIRDISLDYAKKKRLSKIYGSAHVFLITLYLCKVFNKKINLEDNLSSVELVKSSLKSIDNDYSFETLGMQNEIEKIKQFKSQYSNFPLKKFDSLSLNHFITNLNNSYRDDREHTVSKAEQYNELINQHDFAKGLSFFGAYLGFNQINLIDLQNITPIGESDVSEILNFIYRVSEEKEEKITTGYLLGALLILKALILDYKKVKNELLNTSIEDTLLEIQNLQGLHESKLISLQSIEKDLIKTVSSQKSTIDLQQREISKLTKSNESLSQRIAKLEERNLTLSETINDIQEFSYTSILNREDQQTMRDFLLSKKLIVIGGDPKWVSQLTNALPNLDFLSPDELNKNIKHISNYDGVFFNFKVNNHSMYSKVKKSLKNSETTIKYCSEHSNIEINIHHFYYCFQNN